MKLNWKPANYFGSTIRTGKLGFEKTMFLQTGLGVLVGFSNRFRIFNFWFCKPSLCGLEIGTKLEWNLHKKILFYQKNKSNAPKKS